MTALNSGFLKEFRVFNLFSLPCIDHRMVFNDVLVSFIKLRKIFMIFIFYEVLWVVTECLPAPAWFRFHEVWTTGRFARLVDRFFSILEIQEILNRMLNNLS